MLSSFKLLLRVSLGAIAVFGSSPAQFQQLHGSQCPICYEQYNSHDRRPWVCHRCGQGSGCDGCRANQANFGWRRGGISESSEARCPHCNQMSLSTISRDLMSLIESAAAVGNPAGALAAHYTPPAPQPAAQHYSNPPQQQNGNVVNGARRSGTPWSDIVGVVGSAAAGLVAATNSGRAAASADICRAQREDLEKDIAARWFGGAMPEEEETLETLRLREAEWREECEVWKVGTAGSAASGAYFLSRAVGEK